MLERNQIQKFFNLLLLCCPLIVVTSYVNAQVKAPKEARESVEHMLKEAQNYFESQKYDSADLILKSIVNPPQDLIFHYNHLKGQIALTKDQDYFIALDFFRKAKSKISKSSSEIQSLYLSLGGTFQAIREYDSSRYYLSNLLKHLDTTNQSNSIIKIQTQIELSKTFAVEERFEIALSKLRVCLSDLEYLNVSNEDLNELKAHVYGALSYTYGTSGVLDSAFYFIRNQVAILEQMKNPNNIDLARSYGNLSYEYMNQGLSFKADFFADKAISKYKETVGNNYKSLGYAYLRKATAISTMPNRLHEALDLRLEALRIYETKYGTEHIETVYPKHEVGRSYFALADYAEALKFHLSGLKISKQHQRIQNLVESNYSVGETYLELGEYEKSRRHLLEGKNLIVNSIGPNYIYHSYFCKKLAVLESKTRNINKANQYFLEAVKTIEANFGNSHPLLAETYLERANTLFNQEKYLEALNIVEKASFANKLDIQTEAIIASPITQLEINNLKSKILMKLNSLGRGKKLLIEAKSLLYDNIDLMIDMINDQSYEIDLLRFSSSHKETFNRIINLSSKLYYDKIDDSSIEDLFLASEKSRAILLRQFSTNQDSYTVKEKRLMDDHKLYLSLLLQTPSLDTIKKISLEQSLFRIRNELQAEKKVGTFFQVTNRLSVKGVQDQLDEKTGIIEYLVSDSLVHAFYVDKNTLKYHQFKSETIKEYFNKETFFYSKLDSKTFYKTYSSLYKILIAPFEEVMDSKNLIILPDEYLWSLNFDLLITGENDSLENFKEFNYFLKDYNITYSNSLSFYLYSSSNNSQKSNPKTLGMAFNDIKNSQDNPRTSETNNLNRLPGSAVEVNNLSKIFEGEFYYGSDATETIFKQKAKNFDIIHLAIHGQSDTLNYQNSRLYFYQKETTEDDGVLYNFELEKHPLSASLAVLSSCETGSGVLHNGEGILSLGRSFQKAGVKSLMLSRAEIPDYTTSIIMTDFYNFLKLGYRKSEALRKAKLKFIKDSNNISSHPEYWAGLFILGDDSPIVDSIQANMFWLLFFVTAILIISVSVLKRRFAKHID